MFGSQKREIARLRSLAETRRIQAAKERKLRETAIGNQARMARQFTTQHDELTRLRKEQGADTRLTRALKACARYRRDLAARDRLIRDQQNTLDVLLGLDSAAVEAGADWQNRRTDRPAVSS
ncbi:MAG: hypothetical protein JWO98_1280 [Frankiales bacterium]|nr:hypothetical protein [Frankiales bacterium]